MTKRAAPPNTITHPPASYCSECGAPEGNGWGHGNWDGPAKEPKKKPRPAAKSKKRRLSSSRAQFEAWAAEQGYYFDRHRSLPDEYESTATQDAWLVWKAARANKRWKRG